jgi:hypothetical protein
MMAFGGVISKRKMITKIIIFFANAAGVLMAGTEDVATMNRTQSCRSLTGDPSDNTTNGKKIETRIVTC